MKVKTKDLTGPALDWAVASIEKLPKDRLHVFYGVPAIDRECLGQIDCFRCEFSTNWVQGGPIIEREKLSLVYRDLGAWSYWQSEILGGYQGNNYIEGKGPTPLIAGMRCYVASELGDEVEVPDELLRSKT